MRSNPTAGIWGCFRCLKLGKENPLLDMINSICWNINLVIRNLTLVLISYLDPYVMKSELNYSACGRLNYNTR